MGVEQGLLALIGAADAGGYEIEQSLRFNSADSANLSRTPSSTSNRRTYTVSCWVKRAQISATQMIWSAGPASGGNIYLYFTSTDELQLSVDTEATGIVKTNAKYRDPGAWYHIVCVVDTTEGTAADRIKFFVNGAAVTSFASASYPSQGHETHWNHTSGHRIGQRNDGTAFYLNGYVAEFHNLDGIAVTNALDFGEYDNFGVWRPKRYTGSYTDNSFYLKFDAADVDGDSSGLGNDWTANNFTTSGTGTDVMSDTPTTNWCTFNSAYASQNNSGNQFSEGNLRYVSSGLAWRTNVPTFGSISSGKWYWEWSVNTADAYCGIIGEDVNTVTSSNTQSEAGTILYYSGNGNKRIDNVASSYGSAYNGGGSGWNPVVGIALDKDNNTITFYRNGVSQGTINLSSSSVDLVNKPVRPAFIIYDGTSYGNFGQFAFQHTPPTGFKALNTKNLPAPTIKDGSKYFDTALYAGSLATAATVGATQTVTGLNTSLTPDMVWIKNRGSGRHVIFDVERLDADGDNALRVDSQDQESANVRGGVSALNAGGFTAIAGSDSSDSTGVTCQTGNNYVAWAWAEGATQGMDVLTGTGGTAVNHNLGVAPDFVIFKYTNATSDWNVYHKDITSTSQRMILNSTAAVGSISASWTINATNFAYGGGSNNWVAYLFSEVEGFSKFGKYTGNGNADGPFVYCGFRPRWIMLKKTNTSTIYTSWSIYDTARDSYNVSDAPLYANVSDQEGTNSQGTVESGHNVDILSNGFKLRDSNQIRNTSGDTYLFAAFAENPFGGSGVSPATAR